MASPLAALHSLVAQGETETLEFKRSTAELRRAGETMCAFLNGQGGQVLIGVGSDGRIVGQQVSDTTLRDIAAMLGCFEPSSRIELSHADVGDGRQVIVLEAAPARKYAPFVFEAKPYKRVGSKTKIMSQDENACLLLDQNHSRHRWENQPAVGVRSEDLDREEDPRHAADFESVSKATSDKLWSTALVAAYIKATDLPSILYLGETTALGAIKRAGAVPCPFRVERPSGL